MNLEYLTYLKAKKLILLVLCQNDCYVLNCVCRYSNIGTLTLNAWHLERNLQEVTGEGNGTPLQYSCLENPMDGGAWQAAVHGVAKSRTRLSIFIFTFHFHALEKEMATHSSVLAWRIPESGEPGGLPSVGSHSRTRLKRLSSSSSRRLLGQNDILRVDHQ